MDRHEDLPDRKGPKKNQIALQGFKDGRTWPIRATVEFGLESGRALQINKLSHLQMKRNWLSFCRWMADPPNRLPPPQLTLQVSRTKNHL